MDADAWEIRNSASLLYAALIMRILGFRNMQQVSESQSLSADGFQTCSCDSNGCSNLAVDLLAFNMQRTAQKHMLFMCMMCSLNPVLESDAHLLAQYEFGVLSVKHFL